MDKTAIIILAAGESSRLGRPKQTLFYNGTSLLQHVANEALKTGLSPVIVVTGANEDVVLKKLDRAGLTIVSNQQWSEGMSAGIRKGIAEFKKTEVKSVIISVCDQPYLSADVFTRLIQKKKESSRGIVASSYAGTLGTPVLFDIRYLQTLEALHSDQGAKHLLGNFKEDVAHIEFEAGVIDIDTEDDYNLLLDQSSDNSLE